MVIGEDEAREDLRRRLLRLASFVVSPRRLDSGPMIRAYIVDSRPHLLRSK